MQVSRGFLIVVPPTPGLLLPEDCGAFIIMINVATTSLFLGSNLPCAQVQVVVITRSAVRVLT